MPTTTTTYRFHLPKKAIKGDCPDCSPRHRRTMSRYVDSQTGEALPEEFGRCDREANCGYHLSPYHKDTSGISYADTLNPRTQLPKVWFKMVGNWKRNGSLAAGCRNTLTTMAGATDEEAERVVDYVFSRQAHTTQPTPPRPVFILPTAVFAASQGHYGRNQFFRLLCGQFGMHKATELMQRFQIGTSARWPGACVFWIVDQQQCPRGGQVVLFGEDWHKAKYADSEGNRKPCIDSVSNCLVRQYNREGKAIPDGLANSETWAVPFGLHQLTIAPIDRPVAIVEAPKTAVICSAYFPEYTWLAIGSKSNLTLNNLDRIASIRYRKIMLYPDLNAYHDKPGKNGRVIKGWSTVAAELGKKGFNLTTSEFLEQQATDEQREQGLDLADFLLNQPPRSSGIWPPPGSLPEFILVDTVPADYPPYWDQRNDANDVSTI